MTERFDIAYSEDAKNDLKILYAYIANELKSPSTGKKLVDCIRKEIRSLDFMPLRYALVDWEPWASMKVHKLVVKNHVVFYIVDEDARLVTIVHIFYGGRNIADIINALDE